MIHYYYRRRRRSLPKRNKYSDCFLVHICLSSCPLLSSPLPKMLPRSSSVYLLYCSYARRPMQIWFQILYFKLVHTSRASENIIMSWERIGRILCSTSPIFLLWEETQWFTTPVESRWQRVFKSESFPEFFCSPFFFVIQHNDARTQSAFLSSFLRKKATQVVLFKTY